MLTTAREEVIPEALSRFHISYSVLWPKDDSGSVVVCVDHRMEQRAKAIGRSGRE